METTIPWEPLMSYDDLKDYVFNPTTTTTTSTAYPISSTWIDSSKISLTSVPMFATDTQLSDAREELNERINTLEHQSIEHKNKIELHIEELEQDIDYFEGKRQESDTEISELRTHINDIQSYVYSLRAMIDNLQAQMKDMNALIHTTLSYIENKEVENEC